jgi:hypothetical protein
MFRAFDGTHPAVPAAVRVAFKGTIFMVRVKHMAGTKFHACAALDAAISIDGKIHGTSFSRIGAVPPEEPEEIRTRVFQF